MRIFNWNIEFRSSAKRKITGVIYRRPAFERPGSFNRYTIGWFKFTLSIHQDHLELVRVCTNCFGDTILETVSAGDESWDICPNCRTIEGPSEEITIEALEAREGALRAHHAKDLALKRSIS